MRDLLPRSTNYLLLCFNEIVAMQDWSRMYEGIVSGPVRPTRLSRRELSGEEEQTLDLLSSAPAEPSEAEQLDPSRSSRLHRSRARVARPSNPLIPSVQLCVR